MTPHSNSRSAWPSGDDNTGFNLIVILVGLCVGSALTWYNYHAEISTVVMALRHGEIALVRHLTDRFDLADRQMQLSDPSGVTLWHLYSISHAIGLYWRIPAVAFIILLASACTLRNAPSRFRRRFNLDGLAEEQASSFPASAAFARRRALELVAPAEGETRPADYALTAPEWIARHAAGPDGSLNVAAARRALVVQLGRPWTSALDAEPAGRCMFLVLALHLAEQRGTTLDLLGELSTAFADLEVAGKHGPEEPLAVPGGVLSHVDAVLHHGDAEVVRLVADAAAVAGRHAWTNTALMGLLNAARQKAGVLPPGLFAWLKLVDRPMWYALHSLGFETEGNGPYLHPNPRVEALGARDHWAVERAVGGSVKEPNLDRALDTLRQMAASSARKRS